MSQVVNCKLCRKASKLVNSHVIPRPFWKQLLDDGPQYDIYKPKQFLETARAQSQHQEYLLCKECDGETIKHYEDHMYNILKDVAKAVEASTKQLSILIPDPNPSYTKLFQLSILWRASVSKDPFYESISLGDKYEEELRIALLTGVVPSKLLFPCIIMPIYRFKDGRKEFLHGFIGNPQKLYAKADKRRLYRFEFGGCVWLYLASHHRSDYSDFTLSHFDNSASTLEVMPWSWEKLPYLKPEWPFGTLRRPGLAK